MANYQRLKLLAEPFGALPDKEYLQQVAHELQKSDNKLNCKKGTCTLNINIK